MISLPIRNGQSLVLFTDLDGTLIDHHTYSHRQAEQALFEINRRHIPLVFCSSKTFSEQVYLQQQIGVHAPFIIENGSAIVIPKGYFPPEVMPVLQRYAVTEQYEVFALAHADANVLHEVLRQFSGVRGFSDVSDSELSLYTGLHGEALQRARDRWFTETIVETPDGMDTSAFLKALASSGFTASQGGRFRTIQSALTDKGVAMRHLISIFRQTLSSPIFAAIGDSPNDAPMLNSADIAFQVRKADGNYAHMELDRLVRTSGIGPSGFEEAVRRLLYQSAE
ncbi:MAG: HAD-IIB family hydrolase [Saprospiraceae bacterium]|nr:HAD-IIB family hydrolase [Saprospiraceae bacterium]